MDLFEYSVARTPQKASLSRRPFVRRLHNACGCSEPRARVPSFFLKDVNEPPCCHARCYGSAICHMARRNPVRSYGIQLYRVEYLIALDQFQIRVAKQSLTSCSNLRTPAPAANCLFVTHVSSSIYIAGLPFKPIPSLFGSVTPSSLRPVVHSFLLWATCLLLALVAKG
jgi:hypothetical protein